MTTTCPLSEDELASIRAPIAEALTPPARAYNGVAFFAAEVERIFKRNWMALCFAETLPNPGDMKPMELFGMPLAVIRGDDGVIRVFHNICPYDGCLAVLDEARGATEIETYYHGWRYDLRGRLTAAPYWNGDPDCGRDGVGDREVDLAEVRSATRFGVVFIDLGGEAGDVDDYLAPLRRCLGEYDLDATVQVQDGDGTWANHGRMLETNWKTYLENAAINILHEGFTHELYRKSPEIPRVKDGEAAFFNVLDGPCTTFGYDIAGTGKTYWRDETIPHLGSTRETPPEHGFFLTYYPNLVIPIRWNMARVNICIPEQAGRTRLYHMSYFHEDAPKSEAFTAYHERIVGGFTQVYAEDGRAVEAVQKGRHSPAYQRHYYAPFWDGTHHHFNTLVADDLAWEA